jgi:hypothetical protein
MKVNRRFGGTCRLHPQGRRISQARDQSEAGGKHSNRLAAISDYVGKKREMEHSKSVPAGLPVGQIGSHKQPSEPIGDKNRITNMALKRTGSAGL